MAAVYFICTNFDKMIRKKLLSPSCERFLQELKIQNVSENKIISRETLRLRVHMHVILPSDKTLPETITTGNKITREKKGEILF